MSNKNPFEIRSEMLQLAKDYMDQQTQMNVKLAEEMVKAGAKTMQEIQSEYKMYTVEELMEKAREMYSFVSNKD